ncbi:outer membrane protein assembly factor BamA [Candidatus Omnitrophota bacterium]
MKLNTILWVVLFLSCGFNLSVCAEEDFSGKIVTKLDVQGNTNISGATILSKVRTKKGIPFSQLVASDDLKRLYSLGYFTDIKIDLQDHQDGVAVIFRVEELPIITEINLSGVKTIREGKLKELIKSKTGEFFDLQQLKQDMRDIQKNYEGRGFPLADIDYELQVDAASNEAKIVINIQEKTRVKIKEIIVEGNEKFKDKKILKLIRTRRDTLFTSGVYKEEVLELDLERITAFYRQNGFLDVQVSSRDSLGPEGKDLRITITLVEGKQYLVGEISLKGTVIFPERELRNTLALKTGDIFNRDQLRYEVAKIQTFYFERGYITAEVDVDTILDAKSGKINLVYEVIENELAYINKIKIRGNTKTKDIVIRRELRSYPGEAFDGAKLTRSKERLYNLGFFQEVSYDTEPTTTANSRDLIVNVKEAKTGEFAFGAGFSSVEKFVGFAEIAQKNFDITNWQTFTGAGQDLRLKMELGSTSRQYDLSFTEPWIFGYPLSFGVDAFNTLRDRSGTTGYSYDEERLGGDIRLGKEFSEYVRADWMYKIEKVDIANVPSGASLALLSEVGENTVSSMFLSITRDTRDNIFSPSRGLVLSVSSEVAGGFLGQDKDFYKLISGVDYYKLLGTKLLLQVKAVAGGCDSFEDTNSVPIYERFYAGGTNTIRGFKERDVGPKDITGEPVGGESTLYGTCELTYPVLKFFKLAVFTDFGNVWDKLGEFASGDFKYSAGLGVRVKTPVGPVKLDYGYPLGVDEGEDKEGRFHFSMSRGF